MKHLINPLVDCVFKKILGAEENYLLYQSRLDAARVYDTWQAEIAKARAERDQEQAEKERLLALLKKAGIDPDAAADDQE